MYSKTNWCLCPLHSSNSLSYIISGEAGKSEHLAQGKKEIHEEIRDCSDVQVKEEGYRSQKEKQELCIINFNVKCQQKKSNESRDKFQLYGPPHSSSF